MQWQRLHCNLARISISWPPQTGQAGPQLAAGSTHEAVGGADVGDVEESSREFMRTIVAQAPRGPSSRRRATESLGARKAKIAGSRAHVFFRGTKYFSRSASPYGVLIYTDCRPSRGKNSLGEFRVIVYIYTLLSCCAIASRLARRISNDRVMTRRAKRIHAQQLLRFIP